jgi:hypothetical protein
MDNSQLTIKKITRGTQYKPIKFVMFLSLATILLYYICPQEWSNRTDSILFMFLLACNLMLFFGYTFGINVSLRKRILDNGLKIKNDIKAINFLKVCSKVYIVMFLPDFFYTTRIIGLSLGEILTRFKNIIYDPAKNYTFELSYINSGTMAEKIYVIVNVLSSFFFFPIVPLSIIFWQKLSKKQKGVFFLYIIFESNKWLLKGMNKGIFDLVIIISVSLFVKYSLLAVNKNSNKPKKVKSNKSLIILLFVGAISLFMFNFNSRTQGNKVSYYSPETGVFSDPNSILLQITPSFFHNLIISFSSYLTQGYEALGYALKVNFTSTFPFGSSVFLIDNFDGIFGLNIWNNTYMVRIDNLYGWDQKVNWHSLYMWLANDVSFWGVPFIMFIIGIVFASAWKDIVFFNDYNACIVFVLLFILFFYISANNQIMSFAYDFIPFWGNLIIWYFRRLLTILKTENVNEQQDI